MIAMIIGAIIVGLLLLGEGQVAADFANGVMGFIADFFAALKEFVGALNPPDMPNE